MAMALSPPAGPAKAQLRPAMSALADTAQAAGFDIYLPLRNRAALESLLDDLHRPGSPRYRHWLTPGEFAARFGAHPAAMARIIDELRAAGLEATRNGSLSLHVSGNVASVERLFATRLAVGQFGARARRLVAVSAPRLPASVLDAGGVVAHFTAANHMRPHSQPVPLARGFNRYAATGLYWFDDLRQAYAFPAVQVATGKGARIGILMAGNFNPADMATYFGHEGTAVPSLATVQISGGAPFDETSSTVQETELDVQQSGGMAPGASITLFNLPDLSDAAILSGLVTIVENNATDVVSMSFGAPELGYTAAYNGGVDYTGMLQVYDSLFAQGNAQGITFVASSGDQGGLPLPAAACFAAGASKGCGSFVRGVEMPASSPHVTAVGGTNLVTAHALNTTSLSSAYVSEAATFDAVTGDPYYGTPATGAVWGSGGGVSMLFRRPAYQARLNQVSTTYRAVPDLALHMGGCPGFAVTPCGPNRSGDIAVINSRLYGVIGTSASAPDFAGVLALRIQLTGGRLGNVNYDLYARAAAQANGAQPPLFRTGIVGNNGAYKTGPGYNAVLGNGSLIVNAYLGVSRRPVAGVPMTPSNP